MTSASFKHALSQLLLPPVIAQMILACVLALLVYSLESSAAWVEHTDQVLGRMNKLTRLMIDEETGVRGYLLTGRKEFLEPYERAKLQIDPAFQQLQQLVADPLQTERLRKLSADNDAWEAFAAARLTATRTHEELVADSLSAKARMDEIQKESDQFIETEEVLRAQNSSSYARFRSRTLYLVLPLLVALGTALVFLFTRRMFWRLAKTQVALQENETLLTTLANYVPQMVWMCTPDGLNVYFNQRWVEYTGMTLEESYGRGWNTPFHPDDKQAAWEAWDHALQTGGQYRVESRLRAADGSYRWFLIRGEPLSNAAGSAIRWFGTCTDIEDLMQAEQVLRTQRQMIESLVNNLPCSVAFVRGRDLTFQLVNLAYQAIAPGKEMVGKTVAEVWPESHPLFTERCRQVLETNAPFHEVDELHTLSRSSGGLPECTYFTWSMHRVRLPGEDEWGILITLWETTGRKQAEEALLRTEKLAAVGRMATAVAHEINNPLAAVMNSLFLAMGADDLPEPARHYLETADAELKRIAHITRQSLGFYREWNAPAVTRVSAVLESTVDILKSKILMKKAVIQKQLGSGVHLIAVAGELRQVFSNLLLNSLDAIDEKGTVKLRVSTGSALNGQPYVRITVADNGQGVSASSRQHLFEPFFTTKGSVGTGLGLWVSKEIIKKHGGSIRVRSSTDESHRGTVFSVVLPLEPAKGELAMPKDLALA